MDEQWKDIPGYEGLYQASNTGLIRSVEGKITSNERYPVRRWKSRILIPKKRMRVTGQYDPRVDLWKDGTHKSLLVSRLVAMTWCGGYSDDLTVNHIDGDTLNNTPQNLEWITRKENIQKARSIGLYTAQKRCALKSKAKERTYVFMSEADASRFLGWNSKYINNRLHAKKQNAFAKDGEEFEIEMF